MARWRVCPAACTSGWAAPDAGGDLSLPGGTGIVLMPLKPRQSSSRSGFASSLASASRVARKVRRERAQRWIELGPVRFQPSELMKIFAALYAADYTVRKLDVMGSFMKGFLPMLVVILFVGFLLLSEPDFGAFVVITTIAIGAPTKTLLASESSNSFPPPSTPARFSLVESWSPLRIDALRLCAMDYDLGR